MVGARRLLAVLVAIAVGTVGFAFAAPGAARADTAPPSGTPATVSTDGLPTWQINGVAWSQVVVNDVVYVTGSFTKARPPGVPVGGAGEVSALNIFAYNLTTGNRVTTFSHSLNAQGRVVTAAPDGSRIYVGGDFTAVDGVARGHLAAFSTASGALDSGFSPNASGGVRALAATASTLYIGGSFGTLNGVARKNLGAVATSTGALSSWAPKADNGSVWSMVMAPDRSRLIVGGGFTTLNSQSAVGMGSVSATTGANQPWAANATIRNGGSGAAITSLRTDGKQIFGSGYAYGGGNFEGTFAADPLTGKLSVVNDCHGDTYDVHAVGSVLYSVGHAHDCTWIRSFPDTNPRVRHQRALAQTITPSTTNTGPDNYGWNYAGQPASAVLHWFPQLTQGSYTGQNQAAWSITGNADYIVLGGEFAAVNGVAQQGLVRMAVSRLAPNRRGPTYSTQPWRPVPATSATCSAPGSIRVTFGTAWDYDNASLTYEVRRDGGSTAVYRPKIQTNFWTLPSQSFTDTGLPVGSSHTYQIKIIDDFGNRIWSPKSTSVTC